MEFNDLPLTLTAGEARQITGLPYYRLRELEEMRVLEEEEDEDDFQTRRSMASAVMTRMGLPLRDELAQAVFTGMS